MYKVLLLSAISHAVGAEDAGGVVHHVHNGCPAPPWEHHGGGHRRLFASRNLAGDALPENVHLGTASVGLLLFVMLIGMASGWAWVFDYCPNALKSFRPPYTLVLFLFGVLLAYPVRNLVDDDPGSNYAIAGLQWLGNVDPHFIFFVLLPPLLYEDSSSMSFHVFQRTAKSALTLAVPGVLLGTGFLAIIIYGILPGMDEWYAAFLLASVLAATDPVAVINALHALGAPETLVSLIAGESLFNDGAAVVVFTVFYNAVEINHAGTRCTTPWEFGCLVELFLQLGVGGLAFGLFAGIVLMTVTHLQKDPTVQVTTMIIFVYGVFFVGEVYCKVSGVLASVVAGLFYSAMGYTAVHLEAQHQFHHILGQISYISNQLLFLVAGVVVQGFMFDGQSDVDTSENWGYLFILYFFVMLARAVVVALCYPLMERWGYGISVKECILMTYGGLRGAVGLALALLIVGSPFIGSYDARGCFIQNKHLQDLIAFHISGIVLLTLCINGTTFDILYKYLDPYPEPPARRPMIDTALEDLEKDFAKKIAPLKTHPFYQDHDFDIVLTCIPDYKHIQWDDAGMPHPAKECARIVDIAEDIRRAYGRNKGMNYANTLVHLDPDDNDTFFSRRVDIMTQLIDQGQNVGKNRRIEFANGARSRPMQQKRMATSTTLTDGQINHKISGDRGLPLDGILFVPSSDSLDIICKEDRSRFNFDVKYGKQRVVVGVIDMQAEAAAQKKSSTEHLEQVGVPGTHENSVGFDCYTRSLVTSTEQLKGLIKKTGTHEGREEEHVSMFVNKNDGGFLSFEFTCNGDTSVHYLPHAKLEHLKLCVSFLSDDAFADDDDSVEVDLVKKLDHPSKLHVNWHPVPLIQVCGIEEGYHSFFNALNSRLQHEYESGGVHGQVYQELLSASATGLDACHAASSYDHDSPVYAQCQRLLQQCRDNDKAMTGFFDPEEVNPLAVMYAQLLLWIAQDRPWYQQGKWRNLKMGHRFHYTRDRLEALLVFIEAMEHVLSNNLYFSAFPSMRLMAVQVVTNARDVALPALELLHPYQVLHEKTDLLYCCLLQTKKQLLEEHVDNGMLERDVADEIEKDLEPHYPLQLPWHHLAPSNNKSAPTPVELKHVEALKKEAKELQEVKASQ